MTDPDPIVSLPIDGATHLQSVSYYDANRLPPGTRMWIEANWTRDPTYQRWLNPAAEQAA